MPEVHGDAIVPVLPGAADNAPDGDAARALLAEVTSEVLRAWSVSRRVMTFEEYLALFVAHPARHGRGAAQYIKDVFDHYGTEEVRTPRGKVRRFRLFDCAFDGGRDRLIAQEEAQNLVYRALGSFVREGRVNRLVLMHGPNGSAKSTFVACVARAMEHYSTLDEGAVYRLNWVFPSQKLGKGGIGFGGAAAEAGAGSYAHLDQDLLDARLCDELRDNPILLIPTARRAEILAKAAPGYAPPRGLLEGELGPKNKQIFESLLASHKGDWRKVLRHVQVERFYYSRRYRAGLVTVEPQLAVDARARQLTADRSLAALPPALQTLALHEYSGDLVDANRGLIEFADLLKRPLEAWKYLLGTVEHALVPVDGAVLFIDQVFIASGNETYLEAFKEAPDFQSFKGRLELVRVPYLLDYLAEERVYREHFDGAGAAKHVAPHAAWTAALWAVLTRMRKPAPEKYGRVLGEVVARLGPLEKADLYATGRAPAGLAPEQVKELSAHIGDLWRESDAYPNYEGRIGASPREIKDALQHAAQDPRYACISPPAILEEIEELCRHATVYAFLNQEVLPGGYHDHRKFIAVVRERWLDRVEEEVRTAMGLVDERQYADLYGRYISHVSHWIKKEKVRNPLTDRLEDPDTELMSEMERMIGATGGAPKVGEWRRDLISRVGAWALDHPDEKPDYALVFPRELGKLREAYFEQRRKVLKKTNEDVVRYLALEAEEAGRGAAALDKEALARVELTLSRLRSQHGYCDRCAREAVSLLLRDRYS